MGKNRLHNIDASLKWAVTAYLFLTSIGFTIAALMSQSRYGMSHEQTLKFYLGDEAQGGMSFPKLYSEILQTAHVHSFMMPVIFLTVWLALNWTPVSTAFKKFAVVGGALSILIYNAAPFLLRYGSPKAVSLFTVGGVGLFVFFLVPAALILYETWIGFNSNNI